MAKLDYDSPEITGGRNESSLLLYSRRESPQALYINFTHDLLFFRSKVEKTGPDFDDFLAIATKTNCSMPSTNNLQTPYAKRIGKIRSKTVEPVL